VRTEPCAALRNDQVRVRTTCSGVSPGTERLVYRGDAPDQLAADASLDALDGGLTFPLHYGYCAVGTVMDTGAAVDPAWNERRVFAFQPHASSFVATTDDLIPLPSDVPDDDAVFLPNLETAVNLVMDATPRIGETVVVIGQGIVGLLVTALLSRFPLGGLYTTDLHAPRRERSETLGATASVDPRTQTDALHDALGITSGEAPQAAATYEGADVVLELTGTPAALNDAVACAGFGSRIVVGSWYGTKRAPIDLGSRFHRARIEIVSSQVSTVAPALRGRWSNARRMQTVLDFLPDVAPHRLITDRVPVADAPALYRRLDESPGSMLQPVLTYDA
jgi:threonine dehydrogenase-like Zn-dependent dehydrogenase